VNASASIGQVHQEVSKQRYSISAAIEHWSNEIMGLMMILCLGAAGACWYLLQSWVADEHADRDIRISSNFLGGGDSCKDRDGYVFRYHRIPWEQYVALAFWYCLLLTNACLTRLVCHAGIPHDCHGHLGALRGLHTFDRLMKDGFIIAVLTGVAQRDLFAYLFDLSSEGWFRGLLFLLVFLGTSPVFGSLDLIPSLSAFSLTTGGAQGFLFSVIIGVLVFGGISLVIFHLVWAYLHNPPVACFTYIASRAVIWAVYYMYFHQAGKVSFADFHLHHYMVGYLIAILAEFNHPVSLLLLAIGTGIFVQGLAAYNADDIIEYHLLS